MDYRSVKTALSGILLDRDSQEKIEDVVLRASIINERAWLFLKLYVLDHCINSGKIEVINKNLILNILRVVSVVKQSKEFKANKDTIENLQLFYYKNFKPLLGNNTTPFREGLKQVLCYMSETMITNLENNVRANYLTYVNDYCNCKVDYYAKVLTKEGRKEKEREGTRLFRAVISDVKSEDHEINAIRTLVRAGLKEGDHLAYYIKKDPMQFFLPMVRLAQDCRDRPKLRNVFPVKGDHLPTSIRIDTTCMIELLSQKGTKTLLKKCTNKKQAPEEIIKAKDAVWSKYFHTNLKVFRKKDYHFDHMITTDGISATLLFKPKGSKEPSYSKTNEPYIDEVPREQLKERKVVGIDPNISDLLFCVSEFSTAKNPETLRYTQAQRKLEIRTKKHERILLQEKEKFPSVKDWEQKLSKYDHKTLDIVAFKEYLRVLFSANNEVREFYQRPLWRKFRLHRYSNTQRSEANFLNRFRSKFGKKDEVVIGFGDWEQKRHMKYREPTKGKGFREMFRRAGYTVLLVDEFRTSLCCSSCKDENAVCKRYRGKHGLLRCTICSRLWNRDVNSGCNQAFITRSHLDGKDRPNYLCRSYHRTTSCGKEPASIPTLH